jgi:WhiB family redox-sensing transcriptional regulator
VVEAMNVMKRATLGDVILSLPPTDSDEVFTLRALRYGACRGEDPEVFFPVGPYEADDYGSDGEAWYPTPQAKATCARCPLVADCLGYALRNDLHGTWGGTSRYQRAQLRRPRRRTACPACSSRDMVVEHRHEVCLACGVSWPIVR